MAMVSLMFWPSYSSRSARNDPRGQGLLRSLTYGLVDEIHLELIKAVVDDIHRFAAVQHRLCHMYYRRLVLYTSQKVDRSGHNTYSQSATAIRVRTERTFHEDALEPERLQCG